VHAIALVRLSRRWGSDLIKLNITCREATQITLQAQDRPLKRLEWLFLRLHQRMCRNCRRFARQMVLMRQASARWRNYTD
jgi:hypothetical protein